MVSKTPFGYIRPTQIEEEMRVSYMDYAMSVIVSRALPDVRERLEAGTAPDSVRDARAGDEAQLELQEERQTRRRGSG